MKKIAVGAFLFFCMMLLGFVLGGIYGAQTLVSQNDGLAGAAAVVRMGFAGSFIGLVISVLLVLKQNQKQQLITSLAVLVLTVAIWVFFQFYVLG